MGNICLKEPDPNTSFICSPTTNSTGFSLLMLMAMDPIMLNKNIGLFEEPDDLGKLDEYCDNL